MAGASVVCDPVGGKAGRAAQQSHRLEGRFPGDRLRQRQIAGYRCRKPCRATSRWWAPAGGFSPQLLRQAHDELLEHWSAGQRGSPTNRCVRLRGRCVLSDIAGGRVEGQGGGARRRQLTPAAAQTRALVQITASARRADLFDTIGRWSILWASPDGAIANAAFRHRWRIYDHTGFRGESGCRHRWRQWHQALTGKELLAAGAKVVIADEQAAPDWRAGEFAGAGEVSGGNRRLQRAYPAGRWRNRSMRCTAPATCCSTTPVAPSPMYGKRPPTTWTWVHGERTRVMMNPASGGAHDRRR